MNTLENNCRLMTLSSEIFIINLFESFIRIASNNNFLNLKSMTVQLEQYIPKVTVSFYHKILSKSYS